MLGHLQLAFQVSDSNRNNAQNVHTTETGVLWHLYTLDVSHVAMKYNKIRLHLFSMFTIYTYFRMSLLSVGGQDTLAGIATSYGLDGPGIEDQWR